LKVIASLCRLIPEFKVHYQFDDVEDAVAKGG
jgi:hypothetical protein